MQAKFNERLLGIILLLVADLFAWVTALRKVLAQDDLLTEKISTNV